jgi:hypothetical protein
MPGSNSSSSGMRLIVKVEPPTGTSRSGWCLGGDVVGAGDRVAVRAGGRLAEHAAERLLDRSEMTCSHLPASACASAHDSPSMSVRKRSARR